MAANRDLEGHGVKRVENLKKDRVVKVVADQADEFGAAGG